MTAGWATKWCFQTHLLTLEQPCQFGGCAAMVRAVCAPHAPVTPALALLQIEREKGQAINIEVTRGRGVAYGRLMRHVTINAWQKRRYRAEVINYWPPQRGRQCDGKRSVDGVHSPHQLINEESAGEQAGALVVPIAEIPQGAFCWYVVAAYLLGLLLLVTAF